MKSFSFSVALLLLFLSFLFNSLEMTPSNVSPFGHKLLDQFYLEKGYVNLNHGSFGAPPKAVIEDKKKWELIVERNPDRWFRYEMYNRLNESRKVLSEYIGADPDDVVFVINASHGVNSVLRSIILNNGRVLYLNLAYQMVKNTLFFMNQQFGEQLLEVNITFPTSKQTIIDTIDKALNDYPDIKLASFSHITSIPSLILPVEELVQICHAKNVLVLIDGAHALGQIPLNVPQIDADFYLSNGHKWLYTPKGSAFLWVKKKYQNIIFPPVISNEGQGPTPFQMTFSYEGTMDYSAFLTFPAALKFRAQFGETQLMQYMSNLAEHAGKLLASMWKTDLLVDPSLTAALVNVRIPTTNQTLAQTLPQLLLEKYNTWVPIYLCQGNYYTRISAQIYNELSDYEYLGKAILALIQENTKQ